jgi:hypothetical protein
MFIHIENFRCNKFDFLPQEVFDLLEKALQVCFVAIAVGGIIINLIKKT